jgi:hypothetical protein
MTVILNVFMVNKFTYDVKDYQNSVEVMFIRFQVTH